MAYKICEKYEACPIRRFYEQGKLEKEWVEKYCWGDNKKCARLQLEKKGEPRPDNLLPNGEIREELK